MPPDLQRAAATDPWNRASAFFAPGADAPSGPDGADAPTVRSGRRRRCVGLVAALAVTLGSGLALPMASASADPSAHTWYRLRMCESSNNYRTDTGNAHYGAYQFDISTWQSVGGHGLPSQASQSEQDARALILYRERGWQPWQCAGILGLQEDGDAGSGRTGDIHIGSGGSSGHTAAGVPAFPGGSHWYRYGETNRNIKTFQDQMHKRGYFPVGTGEYGPNTQRMVKQLQRLNGLIPNGYIGPNTWRTAWNGRYTAPATTSASRTAPAFPGGAHWYFYGETNRNIKTFQDQLHARGFFPVGTGEYGWNTWNLVTRLQKQNGLVPNGLIGPNTWKLAWTGTYRAP